MSDTAGQVSAETLAELRRLAAEATPGPWAWDADGDSYMGCGEVFTWGEGVEGGNIAAPSGDLYPRSGYSPQSDMRFIAAANPATVLALLDTVDAVRAEVDDIRAALRGLQEYWFPGWDESFIKSDDLHTALADTAKEATKHE